VSDVALRFGAKDDGLDAQFRKTNSNLDKLEDRAKAVSSSIGGTFKAIAGIAAAAGVANLVEASLDFADAQKKVQAQTSLSVESAQRLAYIAGQTSTEIGNLTSGVLKLQRVLGGFEEGSEKSAEALNRLGLANAAFQNQNPEEQFAAVARAVAGLTSQNEKVLAVTELFGKSGAELLPVLQAIGTESAQLEARLDAIGGTVGQKAIDQVDALGDEFATTSLAAKSLTTEILAIVSPAVIAGLHGLQTGIAAVRHQIAGGNNEIVNIDDRIRDLEAFIARPTGYFTFDGYRVALRNARAELEDLKSKQEEILGVGAGAALIPKMQNIPFSLSAPGALSFEETDEDRAKRLKEESDALQQRIQLRASMHQIEEDMAFRSSLKLAEIDQRAIDESVKRATDEQHQKLEITTAFEYAMEQSRQLFGLRQIQFDEDKNQALIGMSTTLFHELAAQNTKFAKAQQALAIATVIYDTARAVMRAFAELSYLGFAQAALMAAQGALQISKIKATNYSSGGTTGSVASVSGGSAISTARDNSSRDVPEVTNTGGATNVYLSGVISRDVIDYMVTALRENFSRDVLVIPTNSLQAQVIRNGS
jgi:hypothetical protein